VKILDLKKDDFYYPILEAIFELGGSGSNQEIESKLLDQFKFSDEQISQVHAKSGTPILSNKIAWARSYLKVGGLLSNVKTGVWALTEEGRECLQLGDKAVHDKVGKAVKEYQVSKKLAQEKSAESEDASDEVEDDVEWASVLLSKLKSIPPDAFERLAQRILREAGFVKVEVLGNPMMVGSMEQEFFG
jgi:restriction system protein